MNDGLLNGLVSYNFNPIFSGTWISKILKKDGFLGGDSNKDDNSLEISQYLACTWKFLPGMYSISWPKIFWVSK